MEVRFQRTLGDYLEVIAAQRVTSLRRKILYVLAFIPVYILGVILLMSFGLTQAQGSLALLAGMIILGRLISFAYSRWLRRDFKRHPNFALPVRMWFDDSGVHSESDAWSAVTKWTAYLGRRETKNLFLLYLGARLADVIPKRAFSSDELIEFRKLVIAKLPEGQPNLEQRNSLVENPS